MILKTKNITLRPLNEVDIDRLTKLLNNREVCRYLIRVKYPYHRELAVKFVQDMIIQYSMPKPVDYVWGIEINNQFAGVVGLHEIIYGYKAVLGYWLGQEYWGQGIMPLAVKKILPVVVRRFKLKRISSMTMQQNDRSAHVLKKCGFEYEGLAKKGAKKNGRYYSVKKYALVK